MSKEGAMFYAIRLKDGSWWRRGGGNRKGEPVLSFRRSTQYNSKGAAKRAAQILCLEEVYGGWEIVETPRVIGDAISTHLERIPSQDD